MAKYIHSKDQTIVKVDMSSFAQVTKDLGIDEHGKVQAFATKRAAQRMDKYVPFRTGTLKNTADYTSVPTEVSYDQPYARVQYMGKVMAGSPREATSKDLKYNDAPQRGAFWDQKMIGAEGDAWVKEVQNYSDRLKTKG